MKSLSHLRHKLEVSIIFLSKLLQQSNVLFLHLLERLSSKLHFCEHSIFLLKYQKQKPRNKYYQSLCMNRGASQQFPRIISKFSLGRKTTQLSKRVRVVASCYRTEHRLHALGGCSLKCKIIFLTCFVAARFFCSCSMVSSAIFSLRIASSSARAPLCFSNSFSRLSI